MPEPTYYDRINYLVSKQDMDTLKDFVTTQHDKVCRITLECVLKRIRHPEWIRIGNEYDMDEDEQEDEETFCFNRGFDIWSYSCPELAKKELNYRHMCETLLQLLVKVRCNDPINQQDIEYILEVQTFKPIY